jgi:excisionase family DNA binding protein
MPKDLPGIGAIYDLDEVAERLAVSKYTVLRDYRNGRLAGRKFGRRILFTGDAIKSFLESGAPTRRGSKGQQADPSTPRPGFTSREQAEIQERHRIEDAMRITGNHREAAAKKLGYSAVTLRKKFKKYGMQFPDNRGRKI